MFICRQKINLFFAYWNLSLRYWKDIANLLFWVLWACLAMQTQSDNIKLNSFGVYLQENIPHVLLEILQRYANSFWILWASLVMQTQNDSMNL